MIPSACIAVREYNIWMQTKHFRNLPNKEQSQRVTFKQKRIGNHILILLRCFSWVSRAVCWKFENIFLSQMCPKSACYPFKLSVHALLYLQWAFFLPANAEVSKIKSMNWNRICPKVMCVCFYMCMSESLGLKLFKY